MSVYLDTPDQYSMVNGARLHFLDWGGSGNPLLFLPGLGEPASVFKWFAPRFLPEFRPIALTRRGTGKSEIIPGTYQLSQLVEDVRVFMDNLGLPAVNAVGYSYGGFEITRLASLYPDRFLSLVYLDALYSPESVALWGEDPVPGPESPTVPDTALRSLHDYFSYVRASYPDADKVWDLAIEEAWAVDVEIGADGKLKEIERATVMADMLASASEQPLDYSLVRCPMLVLAAFSDQPRSLPRDTHVELREKAQLYQQRQAAAKHAALGALRARRPDATIVEVNNAPHHLYLSHGDEVYSRMAEFLAHQR